MDAEKWMQRSFDENYISEVDFFEKMDANDPQFLFSIQEK